MHWDFPCLTLSPSQILIGYSNSYALAMPRVWVELARVWVEHLQETKNLLTICVQDGGTALYIAS